MANKNLWQDDYWLLLMQLYLKSPVGVKPLYSRPMVSLALELHIPPRSLQKRMEQIARLETPRLERIWATYSQSPQRLARAVRLLRSMNGFGQADEFYDGVEVQETFETAFRPLPDLEPLTPVMLTIILGLYFQLTPVTMVRQTPEVRQTATLLGVAADQVVQVLETYQHCDPYLSHHDLIITPLLLPCQQVWSRYADNPKALETDVRELSEYFK